VAASGERSRIVTEDGADYTADALRAITTRAGRALAERLAQAGPLVAHEADAALREYRALATTYLAVVQAHPAPADFGEDFAATWLSAQLAKESETLFDNAVGRAERRRVDLAGLWKVTLEAQRLRVVRARLAQPGGTRG
jgi:hypothetical protein